MKLYHKDSLREFGGPGSGNWGHIGIPGYRGGSQRGSGGVHARPDNYKEKKADGKKKGPDKNDDSPKIPDDAIASIGGNYVTYNYIPHAGGRYYITVDGETEYLPFNPDYSSDVPIEEQAKIHAEKAIKDKMSKKSK